MYRITQRISICLLYTYLTVTQQITSSLVYGQFADQKDKDLELTRRETAVSEKLRGQLEEIL
ncbi:MAG: hypothetical protein QME68_08635, partial [Elusimicrobiota bacterium]|nr:hypothetical protein [Elusimicrobiota bacterium]